MKLSPEDYDRYYAALGIQRSDLHETEALSDDELQRDGKPDGLIPMIHDVVQALDFAGGRVVVHLMPGLLD